MAFPSAAWFQYRPTSTTNVAIINNGSTAEAYTGGNQQTQSAVTAGTAVDDSFVLAETTGSNATMAINTGNSTAQSGSLVVANTGVGCNTCRTNLRNIATVENASGTIADTGLNIQAGTASTQAYADDDSRAIVTDRSGTSSMGITSGSALSQSRSWTVVNTQWR